MAPERLGEAIPPRRDLTGMGVRPRKVRWRRGAVGTERGSGTFVGAVGGRPVGAGSSSGFGGCAGGQDGSVILAPGRRGGGCACGAVPASQRIAPPAPYHPLTLPADAVPAVRAGMAFGTVNIQPYFGISARTGCAPPPGKSFGEGHPNQAGAGKTPSGRTELSGL